MHADGYVTGKVWPIISVL